MKRILVALMLLVVSSMMIPAQAHCRGGWGYYRRPHYCGNVGWGLGGFGLGLGLGALASRAYVNPYYAPPCVQPVSGPTQINVFTAPAPPAYGFGPSPWY